MARGLCGILGSVAGAVVWTVAGIGYVNCTGGCSDGGVLFTFCGMIIGAAAGVRMQSSSQIADGILYGAIGSGLFFGIAIDLIGCIVGTPTPGGLLAGLLGGFLFGSLCGSIVGPVVAVVGKGFDWWVSRSSRRPDGG